MDLPRIYWKYLLFEWNDSDREINNARKIAKELGIAPVLFVVPEYPSPSKRFRNNEDVQMYLRNSKIKTKTGVCNMGPVRTETAPCQSES